MVRVSVPHNKILKETAPDLGFHVCAPVKFDGRPECLYCVVVPPEIWAEACPHKRGALARPLTWQAR